MGRRKQRARRPPRIVPVILAAGSSSELGFPRALARFGEKTALEIALANCAGLGPPVVVVGERAGEVRRVVPAGVRLVFNPAWRGGQMSSFRAGLARVPLASPVLLYPVDLPLLTRGVIRRLVAGFGSRRAGQTIVAPVFRGRQGHPVIFSPEMRGELTSAQTAREVVFRDQRRLKLVVAGTTAIWQDFSTPANYRRRLRDYQRQQSKN